MCIGELRDGFGVYQGNAHVRWLAESSTALVAPCVSIMTGMRGQMELCSFLFTHDFELKQCATARCSNMRPNRTVMSRSTRRQSWQVCGLPKFHLQAALLEQAKWWWVIGRNLSLKVGVRFMSYVTCPVLAGINKRRSEISHTDS